MQKNNIIGIIIFSVLLFIISEKLLYKWLFRNNKYKCNYCNKSKNYIEMYSPSICKKCLNQTNRFYEN